MPCTMVCLTPIVIASWPVVASYVTGAAAALGFAAATTDNMVETEKERNKVELEMEGSSVLEEYMGEEQQFRKDNVHITVRINDHGQLILIARGNESKEILRNKLQAFAGEIKQVYAYDKAMKQLKQSGFNVVEENMGQNREIHITLRRWA